MSIDGRSFFPTFPRLSLILLAGVILLPATHVDAQSDYALDPAESFFSTGCTGPSICLCPILLGEPLDGTFRLVPLAPALGPIFEFAVEDVEIIRVEAGGTVHEYLGGGLLTIDVIANTQTLTLDLTVDGVPTTFSSVGAVPLTGPIDDSIAISVFAEVNGCIYDGLTITAYPFHGDPPLFVRGDVNQDGTANVADAISTLLLLFGGAVGLPCEKAYDTNDDGTLDISDPIALLGFLFSGTPPLPEPTGFCGGDPTDDTLTCDQFNACI